VRLLVVEVLRMLEILKKDDFENVVQSFDDEVHKFLYLMPCIMSPLCKLTQWVLNL